VLAHVFPEADVPVVEPSVDGSKPIGYHFDLGTRLAPLCERDVLVVASGNLVHNLGRTSWGAEGQGFDWAQRFDDEARRLLTESPADIVGLVDHPDYRASVPTPDHFLPAVYVAGIAAARGMKAEVMLAGCTMGSCR
jgi:4,5-DOPA dioxygenase extradiol